MKQCGFFILILMLCGCVTSPERTQQVYLLNSDVPIMDGSDENVASIVVIDKILLAEYLMRPNLVMQVDGNQLYYSDMDLWAENLQTSIHRTLLAWLNEYAKDTRFVAYNSPEAAAGQKHLVVSIEHFMPTDKGTVISNGQYWLIEKGQPSNQVSQQRFALTSTLSQEGYSHSVTQLAKQLTQLSAQIVADVEPQ